MKETIEYWLINGKDKLRLPVNPESNSYVSPFDYEETEVEGLGEVTTIKKRGLKEFSVSSFWPKRYNPTYCNHTEFILPTTFVKRIESWRNKRKPIRYVVTGDGGVNLQVTIRDFQVDAERGGEPGDVYYTLSLKEWREPKIETVKIGGDKKKKTTKKRPSKPKATPAKTYTVKKGDSLWSIAKKPSVYGDGNKWRKIYDYPANKKLIGSNPNKIKPGMKLVIPK